MYVSAEGLILRVSPYQESSAILTILTKDAGKISAKARGVRRKNSKIRSGCQLLSYDSFSLYNRDGRYTICEAEPRMIFSHLLTDIELLSLGSYFAETMNYLCPEGTDSEEILLLGLRSLYALDHNLNKQSIIKAAFEIRAMADAGFTPALDECAYCGKRNPEYFSMEDGDALCADCHKSHLEKKACHLSPAVRDAMRFILSSDNKKIFSFTLDDQAEKELSEIAEQYLLLRMEQKIPTLQFYHTLFSYT